MCPRECNGSQVFQMLTDVGQTHPTKEEQMTGLPEEVVQNYEDSLQRNRWSWKAELKMTAGTQSTAMLKERCYRWLNGLREAEGDTNFGWFFLVEKGHWHRQTKDARFDHRPAESHEVLGKTMG